MGSNSSSSCCSCCDKQEPPADIQILVVGQDNPAFLKTKGDKDGPDSDEEERASLDRINAEKNKFAEDEQLRKEEFQKEIENVRRNREMLEKENAIRMHGDAPRRIKIENILNKNEFVLFVLSYETENYQRAINILKNEKISYTTIFVDDNTDVRLGIKLEFLQALTNVISQLEALKTQKIQKDINNWFDKNNSFLESISNDLKSIKVNQNDRNREHLCGYICENFIKLFSILCGTEKNLKFDLRNRIDQFILKLIAAYESNHWETFYNEYEYYFDSVVFMGRDQKIIDVKVESVTKEYCKNFHEAIKIKSNAVLLDGRRSRKVSVCSSDRKSINGESSDQSGPRSNTKFWICCGNRTRRNDSSNDRKIKRQKNEPYQKGSENVSKIDNNAPDSSNLPNPSPPLEEFESQTNKTLKSEKDLDFLMEGYKQQINKFTLLRENRSEIQSGVRNKANDWQDDIPQVHRTPSITSNKSNAIDLSFEKNLKDRYEDFAEKMQRMEDIRDGLNREAEEDMKKFEKESTMRIQMFLNGVQLKMSWEEQEREWNDWLKHAREPVIKVKSQFMELDRIRRFEDEEEIQSEVICFHKHVQVAYDKLVFDFGNLTMLSDKYEDGLFLKIVQRNISKLATKLCDLMEEVENFKNDSQWYSQVEKSVSVIDSMDIPTTSQLRFLCENASEQDYKFVVPPKQPKSYCFLTEI